MKRTAIYLLALMSAWACTQPEPKTTDDNIEEDTEVSAPVSAPSSSSSRERVSSSDMNLIKLIDSRSDLSIFRELLHISYLEGIVENDADYTVFAPSNDAFMALGEAKLAEIRNPANAAALRPIMGMHIAKGRLTIADMEARAGDKGYPQEFMGNNASIIAASQGTVIVGDSRITEPDFVCKNGVLHIVDRVVGTK